MCVCVRVRECVCVCGCSCETRRTLHVKCERSWSASLKAAAGFRRVSFSDG